MKVPPVSEVVSEVDKRQGYAKPHGSNSKHGGEGDCTARVLPPDEQVHKEANAKDYSRVESGSEESSSLEMRKMGGLNGEGGCRFYLSMPTFHSFPFIVL